MTFAAAERANADGALAGCPDLRYLPSFLTRSDADACYRRLQRECRFRPLELTLFGRRIASPRLVDWYGDSGVGYRYSGQSHRATGWTPTAAALRDRLTVLSPQPFNFVLVNLYRNGNDAMGWHADNEPELGEFPLIASLSLGEQRRFRLRRRDDHRCSIALELEHGSLLLMSGASQRDWQHCLPRTVRRNGTRINLTFRRIVAAERRRG